MRLILKTKLNEIDTKNKAMFILYIYIYRERERERQGEKGKGKRLGCGPLEWVDYIEKYKQVNLK